MQSLTLDPSCAGALMFVRSRSDLPAAVRAVNQLLACRPDGAIASDILAIVIRPDLDGGVDTLGSLALRASSGVARVWSVCWFEEPGRREPCAATRRARLLAGWASTGLHVDGVVPVWTWEETQRGPNPDDEAPPLELDAYVLEPWGMVPEDEASHPRWHQVGGLSLLHTA